ncbi:MAG: ABC transporter substrate-binding protein [Acidobacteriota bacterium]|jgi:1,4-dihydroxy-6-naphthoate synthase|nr:ABC transporter substrate-binding protein [Acidobacteriota bacterium]
MDIHIAHSPDSDDAFMFYALAKGKFPTGKFRFHHTLQDIETLNRKALDGVFEITAISIHAYPYLEDKYVLLPSGASMGDRYGPMVVAREPMRQEDLRGKRIAVPGTMTSAYLAMKLFQPDFQEVVVPFDQIMDAVKRKEVDAGLLIHEGQLTYAAEGLHLIVDFGEWWFQNTGLPLPLGGNVIRRDLGEEDIREISHFLKASIQYSLDHREEALQYALQFARDLDPATADRFVGMYVNERTLDYGQEGRKAVQLFMDKAFEAGVIPKAVKAEFAD